MAKGMERMVCECRLLVIQKQDRIMSSNAWQCNEQLTGTKELWAQAYNKTKAFLFALWTVAENKIEMVNVL